MIEVSQLVAACVDSWFLVCADETERAMLCASLDSLTEYELLDIITAQTVELLHERVCGPAPLVLTLN